MGENTLISFFQWIVDNPQKIAFVASLVVGGWTWLREEIKQWRKNAEEDRLEEENRHLREAFEEETRRLRKELLDIICKKTENSRKSATSGDPISGRNTSAPQQESNSD